MFLLRFCMMTAFLVPLMKGEIYTSVQDLTKIFSVERKVVDALAAYVIKTEARIKTIRSYLNGYEQVLEELVTLGGKNETDFNEALSERLAGNPLHTYHLVKRLTREWKGIEEHDPHSDWKDIEEAKLIAKQVNFSQFTNEEDLQGVAQGILRLQTVYKLNTTNLVRGDIDGIKTTAGLTAVDCLYLGKNAFNHGLYDIALKWFEQAYFLADSDDSENLAEDQIQPFLDVTSQMVEKLQNVRRNVETNKQMYKIGKEVDDYAANPNYEALCRGEQLLSDAYLSTLTCYLDRRNSLYLTLMPAKVEKRHHDPEVLIFHDAIRETDIRRLKEAAMPKLSRSLVQNPEGKGRIPTIVRTSRTALLNKQEELENFGTLMNYVSYLSGLAVSVAEDSSEALQIANYGVGGHYFMHRDYLIVDKTEEQKKLMDPFELYLGDRLATFMFYLSNVTRGGATVFPKLGVSIFPEEGSAVYWHNLKKSGEAEELSLHGGCPVIHGVKWVSNKWIRFGNQFKRHPCSLSPVE